MIRLCVKREEEKERQGTKFVILIGCSHDTYNRFECNTHTLLPCESWWFINDYCKSESENTAQHRHLLLRLLERTPMKWNETYWYWYTSYESYEIWLKNYNFKWLISHIIIYGMYDSKMPKCSIMKQQKNDLIPSRVLLLVYLFLLTFH